MILHSCFLLRPDVRRKSDLPLYIGQIHAFYFDTTPYTLNDNVNTVLGIFIYYYILESCRSILEYTRKNTRGIQKLMQLGDFLGIS